MISMNLQNPLVSKPPLSPQVPFDALIIFLIQLNNYIPTTQTFYTLILKYQNSLKET